MAKGVPNKSKKYWKHGKHKGRTNIPAIKEKMKTKRPAPEMTDDIKKLFD
jgi:hypothetical protein